MNSSSTAYAALTLSQNGSLNRIISYSSNYANSSLSGAFGIETNSSNGIVFSLNSDNNKEPGSVHVLFDSKEYVTINARSVSIANAFVLRPVTDDEMFQMPNPEPGTIINNGSRKQLFYFNGKDWCQFRMKAVKAKKKRALEIAL
jgi:hypothetical protein